MIIDTIDTKVYKLYDIYLKAIGAEIEENDDGDITIVDIKYTAIHNMFMERLIDLMKKYKQPTGKNIFCILKKKEIENKLTKNDILFCNEFYEYLKDTGFKRMWG